MCTSFAIYTGRPLYGLNFDFPQADLKFRLASSGERRIFSLCVGWKGNVYETAGMNDRGLFSAAQILVAPFEILPLPGETRVAPYEVFTRAMQNGTIVQDVLAALGDRRLGYTTARKGHQIYADRFGGACVLEPGPTCNQIYQFYDPYTILTNSPVERERRRSRNMRRLGLDRYGIAEEVIQQRFSQFSIEDGFELLRKTSMSRGRFTTQCSLVFDPLACEVYVTLRRNYEQVWKFSLAEGRLETGLNTGGWRSISIEVEEVSEEMLQAAHLGA